MMGNSALITVLNLDVQTKIGAELQRRVLTSENHESMENSLDYSDWISRVKRMYTIMTDSLGKSLPIRFLEKIDFATWLDPVAMKGAKKLKDWTGIVTGLEAGLTYTPLPSPPPVPAAGDPLSAANGDGKTAQTVPAEDPDSFKQITLETLPPNTSRSE